MKLNRKNKIIVASALDKTLRDKLLCELLVDAGFAKISSDAAKIIKHKLDDCDLDKAFFIAVYDFKFTDSHVLTHRLLNMSLHGVPIFIGCKNIPNQYAPFCEIFYPEI